VTERSEEHPPQTGGENVGVEQDVSGEPRERRDAAKATPPIGDDAEKEQTAVPAPDDEVGAPPDDEMNRPDR
jgi:hypothetical protein